MSKRETISQAIQMKLWAEAAGRCQLRGCNAHLWYNDLTGSTVKWGEMAHIIGASRNGPRGRWNSSRLQTDPENIMLLCTKCHKTIDYGRNIKDFPIESLRDMKKEHVDRIEFLLDVQRNRTTVVQFTCPIKNQLISISDESIYNAALPSYPDQLPKHWYKINIPTFNYTKTAWESTKQSIDESVDMFKRQHSNGEINDLSIFGIGPIPLLMYLGSKFPDTLSGEVFHANRNNLPENRFDWSKNDNNSNFTYRAEQIQIGKSDKVFLILALSDSIAKDKYSTIEMSDANIYQMTIDEPSPLYLVSKNQLSLFGTQCRNLLNKIQLSHGKNCEIHLLCAIPAAVAISFGRLLMPTKDPKIIVYEYLNGNPEAVIELNI
jgi:hypothetical protein